MGDGFFNCENWKFFPEPHVIVVFALMVLNDVCPTGTPVKKGTQNPLYDQKVINIKGKEVHFIRSLVQNG
jgi:hypothetical protein